MTPAQDIRRARLHGAKKFLAKAMLLFLPFVAWEVVELFVLSPDAFTFRVWEALLATPYRYPGAFYPNQHVTKPMEFGDRYRLGPQYREPRHVEWFTDAYGWRNRPEFASLPVDVVITGDSNIVGSSLDQKNTLSEVLSHRGNLRAYSYSYGADHVSLFFSDPRFQQHPPKLLVVESKGGYWETNASYLNNFASTDGQSLKLKDRSAEMAKDLRADRNPRREILLNRFFKQPFYHFLQSELHLSFTPPDRDWKINGHSLTPASSAAKDGQNAFWPKNWLVAGKYQAHTDGAGFSLEFYSNDRDSYWKSEVFDGRPGQPLVLSFEARLDGTARQERIWLFVNETYRVVFQPVVTREWLRYKVPLDAPADTPLRVQLDSVVPGQRMHLRNVRIEGGQPLPLAPEFQVIFRPQDWTTTSGTIAKLGPDEWSLTRTRENPYLKSGPFRSPANAPLQVRFEARAALPAGQLVYADFYLFQDDKYRSVATPVYSSEWREYVFPLQADSKATLNIQFDLPDHAQRLEVRNVRVMTAPAETPAFVGLLASMPSKTSSAPTAPAFGPPSRPAYLTPLDGTDAALSGEEIPYYFYYALKAMNDEAARRGTDFIFFLMPDSHTSLLRDAVRRLRAEGVKVIAYDPSAQFESGVNMDWYWQKNDSHWSKEAVRLTADEILRMWREKQVENRPFTSNMEQTYSTDFPLKP